MGTEFEIHKGGLDLLRFLLMRWERDVAWLTDYRTREEQDERLLNIEQVLKRHLVHEACWSPISAAFIAATYKKSLRYRLINPKAFTGVPEKQEHE